jgi:ribosomal protein L37AE/L43A
MAELTSKPSPDGIFGTKVGFNSCKLESAQVSTGTSPLCPKCSSKKVWSNGVRYPMFGDRIQRWLCRECGTRFSDREDLKAAKKTVETVEMIETQSLKSKDNINSTCQICDEEMSKFSVNPTRETKNLVTELFQGKLKVPQKNTYDLKDLKGAVVNFVFYLQQNNKAAVTQTYYGYNLDFLVDHGANLFDPFSVKDVLQNKLKNPITQKDKSLARKYTLLKAYRSFANAYDIDVKPANFPKYKPTRAIPYLPPEAHMDQLIAACGYIMAAFLQLLKETGARPVEACRILWEELDFVQRKIPIIHPAKDCNPRVLNMSEKLQYAKIPRAHYRQSLLLQK